MSAVVSCTDVVKSFGSLHAVNGVSFSVSKGECFGLLGPNGAGKSSLIRTLYGASPYNSGAIRVFGLDPLTSADVINERLGVVLQENSLDEELGVRENLRVYSKYLGLSKIESEKKITELLEFMALQTKEFAPIRSLSGGMQRRLAFARALLMTPDLLILDEPTTGLDPGVRSLLWNKVKELKARGTTVILTTHYMEEAENLCDRLVIMNKGKIAEQGSPKELIQKYAPGSNLNEVFLTITGRELSENE